MAEERKGGRYIGIKYSFTGEDDYGWAGCAILQAPNEREGEWALDNMLGEGEEPFWPKYIRENEDIDQGSYESDGGDFYYVSWYDSEAWAEAVEEAGGDPEDVADDFEQSTAVVRVWDKRTFRSRRAAEEWLAEDGCPYSGPTFIPWSDPDEIPRPSRRSMQRKKQPKRGGGAALIRKYLRRSP